MAKTNSSHVVLKKAFDRLQRQNPKFSIRALATKVGVSHVFMMKLLKGQAAIPDAKIPILIKIMGLDDLAQAELRELVVLDAIQDKMRAFIPKRPSKTMTVETFEEFPSKHLSVLLHWYELPILDLLTCQAGALSTKKIARKLGLTEYEVERSLEKMLGLGLASFDEGQWHKTNKNIRFPTSIPSEVTRNYYNQVLKKASDELADTDPERYARRSITNLSLAVDPSKVKEAKERLQKFVYELASELSTGECEEVYFLTTCLFPVTKSGSDR